VVGAATGFVTIFLVVLQDVLKCYCVIACKVSRKQETGVSVRAT